MMVGVDIGTAYLELKPTLGQSGGPLARGSDWGG